jgi:hypothetical protein
VERSAGGGIVVAIDVDETTSEQRGDEEMRGGCLLPSATALATRLSGARGTHRHNTPGDGKGRGGEGIRRTGRGETVESRLEFVWFL